MPGAAVNFRGRFLIEKVYINLGGNDEKTKQSWQG